MTSAALRLRGRHGPLRAEITWPECEPEAIVVLIGGAAPPAETARAVTLRVKCATHHDERIVLEWTEDHARQLGAPSARVIVVH